MIRIQVRPNEPLETALRRFKRQCNYAGIFRLAKKTTVYEKPSEKRRREARERIRNIQRAARKAMQVRKGRRKSFKPRGGAGGGGASEAQAPNAISDAPGASKPATQESAAAPAATTTATTSES